VSAALGRPNLATYLAVTQLWQLLPHGQPLLLLTGPKHKAAAVQGEEEHAELGMLAAGLFSHSMQLF
jgi:hypothetical protein